MRLIGKLFLMSYIFISYDSETDTKTSGLKGLKSANFTLVKCPLKN